MNLLTANRTDFAFVRNFQLDDLIKMSIIINYDTAAYSI